MVRGDDRSVTQVAQELWQLTRDYARQETLDPLKNLGNYLKFGVPGALLVASGVVFCALALLRGLQQLSPLTAGWWWWVPYAATVAFLLVVALLCARGVKQAAGAFTPAGGSRLDPTGSTTSAEEAE